MSGLLVCAALGIEARAIRRGLSPRLTGTRVIATGIGPRRAARAAAHLGDQEAMAVVGFGGAVGGSLRPGDVLVASEVRFRGQVHPCPSAAPLAEELARAGLPAMVGPLVTADRVVRGAERRRLAALGAYAVDMETGPLALVAAGRPLAAVRVIVDTPQAPLLSPATLARGLAARRTLRALGPVLVRWAATIPGTVPFPLPEESLP
ncbi:phosphorylase family protein [Nonomuraea helvata]|uniref:Nucleoside phosphorylase domain-containing protein n=1 Tax=Nonomuraea helvata TaxID=37484 RepID=A0ABV5SJ70_9ACTN